MTESQSLSLTWKAPWQVGPVQSFLAWKNYLFLHPALRSTFLSSTLCSFTEGKDSWGVGGTCFASGTGRGTRTETAVSCAQEAA